MSEITRGAIGMPFEMAMESELSRRQFHSIAQALLAERDQIKAENEIFEDGMRSLASTLGAGGYNAATLTATQLVEKVQWGVDHLAETSGHLTDQLRAEVAGLKTGYEAYERVNAELKAECEALHKGAARYEWLRQARSGYIEVVEWIGPHATGMTGEDLDALLDAAMGKGDRP